MGDICSFCLVFVVNNLFKFENSTFIHYLKAIRFYRLWLSHLWMLWNVRTCILDLPLYFVNVRKVESNNWAVRPPQVWSLRPSPDRVMHTKVGENLIFFSMTFYKEVSEKRSERAQDILECNKDNVAKGKNHSGLKSSNIFDASSAGSTRLRPSGICLSSLWFDYLCKFPLLETRWLLTIQLLLDNCAFCGRIGCMFQCWMWWWTLNMFVENQWFRWKGQKLTIWIPFKTENKKTNCSLPSAAHQHPDINATTRSQR